MTLVTMAQGTAAIVQPYLFELSDITTIQQPIHTMIHICIWYTWLVQKINHIINTLENHVRFKPNKKTVTKTEITQCPVWIEGKMEYFLMVHITHKESSITLLTEYLWIWAARGFKRSWWEELRKYSPLKPINPSNVWRFTDNNLYSWWCETRDSTSPIPSQQNRWCEGMVNQCKGVHHA